MTEHSASERPLRPHATPMARPMARTSILLLAALLANACGVIEPDKTVVRSLRFPAIEIECQGDAVVLVDACRAWGEKLLDGNPDFAARTSRLVLTFRQGDARCAADFYGANGTLVMTASAVCPTLP